MTCGVHPWALDADSVCEDRVGYADTVFLLRTPQ